MPTFDGINLIITLDSGVTSIDWQDIYSDWKDWMLEAPTNRAYPEAFRTTGGDPLNTILDSGSYFFLRNDYGWRIKPPEEDITILATGNLAPEDSDIDMFLPTTGAFTTQILGLQPITQGFSETLGQGLEHSLFDGVVTIDVINGTAGTEFPIGTNLMPVDNVYDARIIALNNGLPGLNVIGDLTVPEYEQDMVTPFQAADFTVYGQGKQNTLITVPATAVITGCTGFECEVTGTLDGGNRLEDCLLTDLTYVNGYIENCVLNPGTITLNGSETAHFLDCYSGVPGTGTPVIDCGGSGQALAMRGYNGGIKLINKTGTDSVSIDLNSGQVKIDLTTVTNGTVVVRGTGKVIDDATGDLLSSGTYGSMTLLNETTIGQADFLQKILRNKRTITKVASDWYLVVYDDDGVTEILNKRLLDKDGLAVTDLASGVLAQEEASSV